MNINKTDKGQSKMFLKIYISDKLREYSEKSYDQGGVFFLDISEDERDLCKTLNEDGNQGGEYPDLDEVALCLHKDWRFVKSWELPKNFSKERIQRAFSGLFDRPDILRDIQSALELYSKQVHDYSHRLSHVESRLSAVYCINQETYKSLWWCFDANDGSYVSLINQIVLDMIQNLIYKMQRDDVKEMFYDLCTKADEQKQA